MKNKIQLQKELEDNLRLMKGLRERMDDGSADADEINKLDEAMENHDKLNEEFRAFENREKSVNERLAAMELKAKENRDNGPSVASSEEDGLEQRRDNFRKFLLGETRHLHGSELLVNNFYGKRAISTQTGGSTEPLVVPETIAPSIVEEMKEFGGMYEVSTIVNTSTNNDWRQPTWDDTGNSASYVAEGASLGTATDPTVGEKTLPGHKLTSGVILVSREALRDENYDIEGLLRRSFANRFGRTLNSDWTKNTDANKPTGMVGQATSFGTRKDSDDLTWEDLVDIEAALDRVYRPNARWMMNGSTLALFKKMKDGDGRPLWLPSVAVNSPSTILGYPYQQNDDMDSGAVDADNAKYYLMFGDFRVYHIRQVGTMEFRVLNELYAATDQVGFVMLATFGGNSMHSGTNASSVIRVQAMA